jgi:hypothetical protein
MRPRNNDTSGLRSSYSAAQKLSGLREASEKACPQSACTAFQQSRMRRGTATCEAALLALYLSVIC